MAEAKDFNDAIDDIFLVEEREHKVSYEEGFKAGSEAGNTEGYHLGYHRGAELGRELGPSTLLMRSAIKKLHHQIDSITHYLTPLMPMANCHMVEFFTENHWETFVPEKLRNALDKWDLNYAVEKFWEYGGSNRYQDNTELCNWINSARNNYIKVNNEYCLTTDQLQDRITSWGGTIKPEIKVTEFMSSKKSYEVATMSRIVASLYSATSSTCCLEAGGGKGHLLVALSLGYGIPSLTVDCDEEKVKAAAERVKIIQKQWHAIAKRVKNDADRSSSSNKVDANCNNTNQIDQDTNQQYCDTNMNPYEVNQQHSNAYVLSSGTTPFRPDSTPFRSDSTPFRSDSTPFRPDSTPFRPDLNLHRFATAFITEETDLAGVVAQKFPERSEDVKLLLTGLHTCGDLGPSSLRIFTKCDTTAGVCTVPCCYHLLTEGAEHNSGFPMSNYMNGYKLGRNARMLAAQSIDRVVGERQLPVKSLLYRALLQVLIKTHLPDRDISEGRLKRLSSKCDNFEGYFKMADAILNLGLFDRLPQSCLIEIYKNVDCQWRKLVLFYLLRLCLAQVIESVILLDRVLFLFENDFDKVFLVKLFDPVLSPRCYAIVAVR